MDKEKLELYWHELPNDKENAVTYADLTSMWSMSERSVRMVLHKLSSYDNGDDYVLIRSARNKGFYKSDDVREIKYYKQECLNKGRSLFAPIRKINRVLLTDGTQYSIENNMRLIREDKGLKQSDVCNAMQQFDPAFDKPMLSKMENSVCLPTPYQLVALASLYECETAELIRGDLYL